LSQCGAHQQAYHLAVRERVFQPFAGGALLVCWTSSSSPVIGTGQGAAARSL